MVRQNQNRIQYTECFIAYIDILGFKDSVRRSIHKPLLRTRLTRAVNFMAEPSSGAKTSRHQDTDGNWIERHWRIQTRAFSDTVVIFMPKESGSITQMLFMIRHLHDRMLELKLCMRGAVTIGGMYWNDEWSNPPREDPNYRPVLYERGRNQNFPVTIGPGLIDAYNLESECAVYPRVLISRNLYEYADQLRITCSPFGPYQPPERLLTDFFRTDADGLHFLDLLHPDITRSDTERIVRSGGDGEPFTIRWERDGNTHHTVMGHVRDLIASSLNQRNCPEKVRAKYEWLRTYADRYSNEQPHV